MSDGCPENKFFICFHTILGIAVSILSILPKVQEHQPRSGLLQSSITALYTMDLPCSAMPDESDRRCKLSPWNLQAQRVQAQANATAVPSATPAAQTSLALVGCAKNYWTMVVLCLLDSSTRSSSNRRVNQWSLSASASVMLDDAAGDVKDAEVWHVTDHEKDGVPYIDAFFFFFLTLLLASSSVMMMLPYWDSPDANCRTTTGKRPGVWGKISCSWVCFALCVWTPGAPLVLTSGDCKGNKAPLC